MREGNIAMPAPHHEPTIFWALFSWHGRMGRRSYFWAAALLVVAQVYLLIVGAKTDQDIEAQILTLGFGAIILWLVSAWVLLAMSIKRLNDIGFPRGFAIFVFIPFFSLLFLFAMIILPGSSETNEHGPPPFLRK